VEWCRTCCRVPGPYRCSAHHRPDPRLDCLSPVALYFIVLPALGVLRHGCDSRASGVASGADVMSGLRAEHVGARGSATALIIEGGRPLRGEVRVPGFKHALVTTVAAAVVGCGPVTIANCPDIEETRVLTELLRRRGGRVTWRGDVLSLDLTGLQEGPLDPKTVARIHGTAYLIPGLLARFGQVHMPATGGCRIGDYPAGSRPVRQYAQVLERFGAWTRVDADGSLTVRADLLTGCDIDLRDYTADPALRTGPLYSGATKMAILAAVAARGATKLQCPYPKPDVTELVSVLSAMGYSCRYRSRDELIIEGNPLTCNSRRPVRHHLVSDLIEVVTWATAAAVTGGVLRLTGLTLDRLVRGLRPEIDVARRLGLRYEVDGPDAIIVHSDPPRRCVDVTVSSHGIFSDSQPFLALLTTLAPGVSRIRETVWRRRFAYVPELDRLGAGIEVVGAEARITGRRPPNRGGQNLVATDLRSAAALLIAALRVPGRTRLEGADHLARGYEDLVGSMRRLGARIQVEGVDSYDPTLRAATARVVNPVVDFPRE